MSRETPEFISAYQGASDFRWKGQRYTVRWLGRDDGQYNPGVFENDVLPTVGTVKAFCSHDYPPEELMAFFKGYVPARYNPEKGRIETIGKPNVVPLPPSKGRGLMVPESADTA